MARQGLAQVAASLTVLGLILIVVGVIGLLSAGGPITCDGKPMTVGDTCITYQNGRESHRDTYASMLESSRHSAFPGLAILVGGVFVVTGLALGRRAG